jgi:hypothetical protein
MSVRVFKLGLFLSSVTKIWVGSILGALDGQCGLGGSVRSR